jgi:glycosyltransferase involved in cell wall biosynthesis
LADAMTTMKTCLIIPCYNEATRIQSDAFAAALQADQGLNYIFVNDGSRDDTLSVLKSFRQSQIESLQNRIHIISYNNNKGKSNAVRIGLQQAYLAMGSNNQAGWNSSEIELIGFAHIEADYLGFWDADLATPLEEIDWFYRFSGSERIKPALLIGSRVARLGANIERTLFRHYSGRLFATLISQGLGWKVHDTQCGAKLMVPEIIPICFDRPFETPWLFDVEILLRLQKHFGISAESMVLEVPIRTWKDIKGSKIGWGDFIKVPYQIWHVFRSYKRTK